ncbi:hypothetical protein B0H14DRAFT_2633124 [Mycena olivaceomarginata]|nr:hypothetical protein B0H14DRAFT_2633124 [Mycena olivaceomarginata]
MTSATFSTPNMVDANGALMFVSLGIDVQTMQISLAADTRKNDLALDLDLELYESLAERNERILYERRAELNERFPDFPPPTDSLYAQPTHNERGPASRVCGISRSTCAVAELRGALRNIQSLTTLLRRQHGTEQQHLILHASCQLENAKHRKQEAEAALKSLQG